VIIAIFNRFREFIMITLREAKEKYQGEWIAFLVHQDGKESELSGEILEHDFDRRELHKRLREKKIKKAYVTFAGELIKPGYEVMF
jgi:hypothetical protein